MKVPLVFILLICALAQLTAGCNGDTQPRKQAAPQLAAGINTAHLERLTVPVQFANGVVASGVYIYAEAPGYALLGDDDEGFTCVDDVSRAALVYLRFDGFEDDTLLQNRARGLLQFVLQMQAPNGYFYNFLLPGDIINKTGVTSRAEPNWWSWRALQTFSEALPKVAPFDTALAKQIDASLEKLVDVVQRDFGNLPVSLKPVGGLRVPTWLPAGSATDQSALLLQGLINWARFKQDTALAPLIRKLATGIAAMQRGTKEAPPYSCILSWENLWHAYGSDAAFSLFQAGAYLEDTALIQQAISEVAHFYPWLQRQGMLSSFIIAKTGAGYELTDQKKFAQIAYGIRPLLFAAAEAYTRTGNATYAETAARLAAWFYGVNPAGVIMYDSSSGRCYDGITGPSEVNRNSGAESTIEALLALQKTGSIPAIMAALQKERFTVPSK